MVLFYIQKHTKVTFALRWKSACHLASYCFVSKNYSLAFCQIVCDAKIYCFISSFLQYLVLNAKNIEYPNVQISPNAGACLLLALCLFVAFVFRTNNHNFSFSFDNLAFFAHWFYRWSYFHFSTFL